MDGVSIHWFRRDLRLSDNPALRAALRESNGSVVPVFVLDPTIISSECVSYARRLFLHDTLAALDAALAERGSRLVVCKGKPKDELLHLALRLGVKRIYFNRDYTPYAHHRDEDVTRALEEAGIQVESFADSVVWEPDTIRTKAGKPYTVYTPFARQWRARLHSEADAILAQTRIPSFAPLPATTPKKSLPALSAFGIEHREDGDALPGGEEEGKRRLKSFLERRRTGITSYDEGRNILAEDGTSRLSAYLHMGCLSGQMCVRAALLAADGASPAEREGIDTWIGELAWRDFYIQILHHFPHVLRGAFKPEYDALKWENDRDMFQAWCDGKTGYPIIDAAMRQLLAEHWMHNRGRMIAASFLVKDLLIDWRWGERHFLKHLIDGDHAANNGGWQWAAGTGTDAQPFFRIFNPVSQGEKFDPQGAYVRRFVPELAKVPDRYIHQPWDMPESLQDDIGVRIGTDYPAPIVDHARQRERALAMYRAVRPKKAS